MRQTVKRSRDHSRGTLLGVSLSNQLGYWTDGVRSTLGTSYTVISVRVFFVVRRALHHTQPCRDTLANRHTWTEIYRALVYIYEYFTFMIHSATAALFSDTTCIYFPTLGAPCMSYKALSWHGDKTAVLDRNIVKISSIYMYIRCYIFGLILIFFDTEYNFPHLHMLEICRYEY